MDTDSKGRMISLSPPAASRQSLVTGHQSPVVDFGRGICSDLPSAESREWLVTNGIGGYACGTIAGHLTRSYHGLLMAALQPPAGRTLLVAKLEETARYAGQQFELATNRWSGGAVAPEGYRCIERFYLEGTTPVWTFALADALLEKRVFMQQGANTTYVLYRLTRASGPVELSVKGLVNYAPEHSCTSGAGWSMNVAPERRSGLRVQAFQGAVPIYLLSASAEARPEHEWYCNFDLAAERARGLPDRADHFLAGEFLAQLSPGDSLAIVASTNASASLDGEAALAIRQEQERSLLAQFETATVAIGATPQAVQQLVLAADQFIAVRPVVNGTAAHPSDNVPEAHTILAGYPWFGDWGRDTMIALPGLTLATGRPALARDILRTWAQFVSQGMLPNRFPSALPGAVGVSSSPSPGAGEPPEYNSVDAALWYFHALHEYFDASQDMDLLRELFPVLQDIMEAHLRGTRYHIHVDPADGLLYAGEPGVQLTWMDSKIGDWVVTPRIGKPVEINALWLNAMSSMAHFARALGQAPDRFDAAAQRARTGFARFWNPATQFCFDVIDAPDHSSPMDASLRPNQIFAVSLRESPLTSAQARAVVDLCARELLTSFGLRSLGPREPGYHGRYAGDPLQRDAAYHQGTVWGWLLGHFALAHLRVYQNPNQAATFLDPMLRQIRAAGLGTAGEIFDGDAPFTPEGCFAQAWTVGETLRAWRVVAAAQNRLATSREKT